MHHADRNAHEALRQTARQPNAPRSAAPAVHAKPATLADALRWLSAFSAVLLVAGLFV
jgi:hypothetical protein